MTDHNSRPIAIIGAGVAGLACARALKDAGLHTVLFDKGRGPGGRLSTRRIDGAGGPVAYDHGAQYFTARDAGFMQVVAGLEQDGHVIRLDTMQFGTFDGSGLSPAVQSEPLFAGAPGMNGVVRGLAAGHTVHWGHKAVAITGRPGARTVRFEDGHEQGPFGAVVIAVPAEQVADLALPHARDLAAEARGTTSAPCWAVMGLCVNPGQVAADAFSVRRADSPIAWVAREDRKPGRSGPPRIVLHATPDWSRAHLEEDAGWVASTLADALHGLTGISIHSPVAHRWRYAQVERSTVDPAYWNPALGLGACGDWRIGPRIELAWLSGTALGRSIAASLINA
jgi:renalase